MKKLTEKSKYEYLDKAWNLVREYGERAVNAQDVKRAFKNGAQTVYRRVNTPEKLPALYVIVKGRKQGLFMPFLIVEGSEGSSFVIKEKMNDGYDYRLTVIHSHAIKRYVERHGWDGDIVDCENYLLDHMVITSRHEDTITHELLVYFDGGVFLGCVKDNICHLNTYVANQHLYPNQRLKSRQLQESIEELMSSVQTGRDGNKPQRFK